MDIGQFWKILIPKIIHENVNLKPGTLIRMEENDQTITLKAIHEDPNLIWKDKVLVYSGTVVGNIDETLKKHREERIEKVGGFHESSDPLYSEKTLISSLISNNWSH